MLEEEKKIALKMLQKTVRFAKAHQLGKLVNRISRREPVFFDTCTSSRVILDLGAGRKKVETTEVLE